MSETVEQDGTRIKPTCDRARMQLLIDALRSGKFLPARGVMANVDEDGTCRFCALGIAIEVAIANGLETVTRKIVRVGMAPYVTDTGETHGAALPPSVVEWYGLDYPWAGAIGVHMVNDVTEIRQFGGIDYWNDAGKTQSDIADALEAEYLS